MRVRCGPAAVRTSDRRAERQPLATTAGKASRKARRSGSRVQARRPAGRETHTPSLSRKEDCVGDPSPSCHRRWHRGTDRSCDQRGSSRSPDPDPGRELQGHPVPGVGHAGHRHAQGQHRGIPYDQQEHRPRRAGRGVARRQPVHARPGLVRRPGRRVGRLLPGRRQRDDTSVERLLGAQGQPEADLPRPRIADGGRQGQRARLLHDHRPGDVRDRADARHRHEHIHRRGRRPGDDHRQPVRRRRQQVGGGRRMDPGQRNPARADAA